MSLIFTLAIALTSSYGQCKFVKNETDEFNGSRIKQLEVTSIGKQVWASVYHVDSLYLFSVGADVGCVNQESTLYLKLETGKVLELKHIGDVNCNMVASIAVDISDYVKELLASKVVKLRLQGTKRAWDADVRDPSYLIKSLQCVQF
jgi:hypothetical protein